MALLISGVTADSPLGLILGDAFGASVRFVSELADEPCPSADLAIGVHRDGDAAAADAFGAWARRVRVPALAVCLAAAEAIIGPVSLPERAGCGRCARMRMTAAEVATNGLADERARHSAVHDVSTIAAAVVSEVAAIARGPVCESRLLDHVLVCDAGSGETSRHRVVPLSRCAICGGAAAWPAPSARTDRPSAEDDPAAVVAALAGWIDPRTGVISRITLELSGEDCAGLPIIATASPPYVVDEAGALHRLPIGWGKGMTLSGALLSAVGEAVERYAPSLPDPDRLVWARPGDLDGEVLDPRSFALYSDAQYAGAAFPFRRFDPDVSHPWVLGRWLGGEVPVWVPAVFAFLSLTLRPEQQLCQGTSNGLAASTDAEDAALRAILELVERDAFMVAWLTACPGRRVTLDDTLDARLAQVLAGIEALGAEVELLVLPTSAFGTTALCLGLGDGDRYPGVTLGLAADLDPLAAVRQAILELAQTGPHLRRMMRGRALPVPEHPRDVHDMIQHAVYYFPVERAAAFDRVRQGAAPVALRDLAAAAPQRSLASCAAALAATGIRVALVDVSSPDVATGPFRVVRAVSPDLQPISYGHGLDHPLVPRIRMPAGAPGAPAIHPLW